jgi:UDP-N-acetylglucosamine 3-dehydrogenase
MNLAILGCGGMGAHHAQMAANCGLKIAACVDVIPAAARKLAKAHKAKSAVAMKALDKVLADPNIDIVLIATPTMTHLELIQRAAAAGKHIFCEKPFCRTVADCKKAIAAAKKAKIKLFVGHVVRYFQEFEAMKAQVEAGKIGEPGWAKIYRGGLFPLGASKWFHDYEQSGGVTFDSSIHDLDWLAYMFGEPERIYCQALQRTKPAMMDYAQITLRMKSGVLATVIGTWAHPSGFRVKAEICGSGGMLQFDSADTVISAQMRETSAGPGMVIPMGAEEVSPYQLEWEDFIVWIESGQAPKVAPEDGLRAVAMAEAALKSAKTGQPVKL